MKKNEIVVDGVEYVRVKNYENYFVSRTGLVCSVDRKIKYSNGKVNLHRGRTLKPFISKHGYEIVTLCRNGIKTKKTVHSIVAESFLENIQGRTEINHKNLCKTDNRVENLEWVTQEENIRHADNLGVLRHFGMKNGNYKVCLH